MSAGQESVFSVQELAYIQSQGLCRMATVGASGQPHVVPVTFRYNPELDTIDLGGAHGFATRKKWRDVQTNPHIAVVIDDVMTNPWKARGIEIRGEAEMLLTGGKTIRENFDEEMIRVWPTYVASWGIESATAYAPAHARKVSVRK